MRIQVVVVNPIPGVPIVHTPSTSSVLVALMTLVQKSSVIERSTTVHTHSVGHSYLHNHCDMKQSHIPS
jgi:hypothetical protein